MLVFFANVFSLPKLLQVLNDRKKKSGADRTERSLVRIQAKSNSSVRGGRARHSELVLRLLGIGGLHFLLPLNFEQKLILSVQHLRCDIRRETSNVNF